MFGIGKRKRNFSLKEDKHVDDTGCANRIYTKSGYVIREKQPVGIMAY